MSLIILCVAAFVFLLVTVAIYQKFWNYGLAAEVTFNREQIEEGQSVVLREKIENRKILPLPTLTVKFELDRSLRYVDKINTSITDKQYRNDCISVMPYQRVIRSLEITGTKRGFYSVDGVNLVAMDILYRQILSRDYENHTWLYVYPARSRFKELPEIFHRIYGECLTNRLLQEDPFEFKGIRDYTWTAPMRKVNWKASAKTGSLKVNQYYDNSSQRLTIFLNVMQKGVLKYDELVEESIRVARSFIEEFILKGVPVRLIGNGVDKLTGQEIFINEGAGLSHIDSCLKQLAKLDIHAGVREMADVIHEQKRQGTDAMEEVSVLISPEQSKELAEAYLEYAGKNGSAYWLIPIHAATERYIADCVGEENVRGKSGNHIHTEYLVLEELG